MQTGNLEFILAWASILASVLAAFVFLHREMRRGFDRVDERFARMDEKFEGKFDIVDERFARMDEKFEGKFDGVDGKFDIVNGKFDIVNAKFDGVNGKFDGKFGRMEQKLEGLRTILTTVQVSVARIEGHLGIGFPAVGKQRADDVPPERAA